MCLLTLVVVSLSLKRVRSSRRSVKLIAVLNVMPSRCSKLSNRFVSLSLPLCLLTPRLGVYYFLSLTLSVCISVCHGAASDCFFFFVSRWNRAIFGRQFSMWHSTKLFALIFDLGPQTPKFTPQNLHLHKNTYKSACVADRQKMLGLLGDFRGWPIQ